VVKRLKVRSLRSSCCIHDCWVDFVWLFGIHVNFRSDFPSIVDNSLTTGKIHIHQLLLDADNSIPRFVATQKPHFRRCVYPVVTIRST